MTQSWQREIYESQSIAIKFKDEPREEERLVRACSMSEPSIVFALLRMAWAPLVGIRRWLGKRFRRLQPGLSDTALHQFFPQDFSSVIKLQVPRSKVSAILGEPNLELYDRWSYLYREAVLQLIFRGSGGSLETIVVGFVGDPKKDQVRLAWLEEPLGRLTLAQAALNADEGIAALEYDDNMRAPGLVLQTRSGPPGAWQYLSYGVLRPMIGTMVDSPFEWDVGEARLKTDPSTLLINWVAISSSSFGNSWFDYTATVPSH